MGQTQWQGVGPPDSLRAAPWTQLPSWWWATSRTSRRSDTADQAGHPNVGQGGLGAASGRSGVWSQVRFTVGQNPGVN